MAKAKKANKLPKTFAGLKLPKALRNSGALGTLFSTNLGREIVAEALVAAAAAAAAALTRHRPSAEQVRHAGEAVAEAGADAATTTKDAVQTAAGTVAGAVTEVARHILPSSLTGEDTDRSRYDHLAASGQHTKKSKQRDKASKH